MQYFRKLLFLLISISVTSYAEGDYLPGMSPIPTRQQTIDLAVLVIASSTPKVSEKTGQEYMAKIENTAGAVWDSCAVAAKKDAFSDEHMKVTLAAEKTGNPFIVEQLGNICSTSFMKVIADKYAAKNNIN